MIFRQTFQRISIINIQACQNAKSDIVHSYKPYIRLGTQQLFIHLCYQIIFAMYQRSKLRPISFLDMELSSNFDRYRKLAELQSKFIKSDLANNRLHAEIESLRLENSKLKMKIHEKQRENTAITLLNNKKTSLGNFLDTTNTSSLQVLKQRCQRFQQNSYQDLSSKVVGYFHRPKELSFGHAPQQNIKLNKNVYIQKQPLKERRISMEENIVIKQDQQKKRNFNEQKHSKNRSITQGIPKSAVKEYQTSKFPSNVNDFQGKKAQSRFLQCEIAQQQPQNLNHWKSQQDFGFKSQLVGHMKSGQMPKRKTFLSVVSVSSKQNRRQP